MPMRPTVVKQLARLANDRVEFIVGRVEDEAGGFVITSQTRDEARISLRADKDTMTAFLLDAVEKVVHG